MNGKQNGKGVEYERFDNIKYEGEFLNGKKNGKIKEYSYNCNYNRIYNYNRNWDIEEPILMFEGEYFNDCKVKRKEFYKNGKLFLKENIYFQKDGMEKYMIIMEM